MPFDPMPHKLGVTQVVMTFKYKEEDAHCKHFVLSAPKVHYPATQLLSQY